MADGAETSGTKITIVVKTPKEKKDIQPQSDSSVKEFRALVSSAFGAPVEQLCLIFAGKILKDEESLSQHGIKDGLTVHLVIKSVNRSQEQAAAASSPPPVSGNSTPAGPPQPADVSQTPFNLGGLGGISGLGGLGMGSANFMEMQQRMQREMMNNPEMIRNMMENPLVQQLMGNPDVMRQLITSNPQMRDLMERNPEITHMLNNPELMRQTMELARNPAMMQELMRTQDRAMSNLESLPGGFNALQRMYRDIQEPMMNAATEGMGNNPFASLVNNQSSASTGGGTTGGDDGQQGRENNDPLPNPWAPTSGTGSSGTGSSGTGSSGTSGSAGSGGGVFNTPGIQSLQQQMVQNPQLMQNMLQAPYMQSMMQSLSANPELAQQVITNNPMFAGNPQLQELMRQQLPVFLQQMQNPEMQSVLTNPRAMQAMLQIQQGMQQLQTEAPNLMPTMGLPVGMPAPNLTGTSPAAATTTSTTTTSSTTPATTATTTTTPGSAGTTDSTNATQPQQQADPLSGLMAHMVQMMAGGQVNQPPEQRYASQLDQLAGMGFVNRDANIQALIATLGDVNAAIDRLLQQGQNL